MKNLTLSVLALIGVSLFQTAFADEYVNGYLRNNGTYVQPYMRTTPNNNPYDNYSTKGNINPYTGTQGTKTFPNPYINNNPINGLNTQTNNPWLRR